MAAITIIAMMVLLQKNLAVGLGYKCVIAFSFDD